MLEIIIPTLSLILGLAILVRGADYFVDGAKAIGSAFGMSAFAVGVLIVGFGTSLPEFASSFAAVLNGATDVAIANVVGSNITNILLIVGLATCIGGALHVKQNLLTSELPVFAIATLHVVFSLRDGTLDRLEALLLLCTFFAYLWYLFVESRKGEKQRSEGEKRVHTRHITLLVGGLTLLIVGATISVDMIEQLGVVLNVPGGLISITVLAIGTSLPELMVTVRSAFRNEHEVAIGNIFGSNVFNALFVLGVPGLLTPLVADQITMELGLPIMVAASLILFIAGLSGRVHRWEGLMMLAFFVFFIAKLTVYL